MTIEQVSDLALRPFMIPSCNWGKNVRSEFGQGAWDRIRRAVYAQADYKCEICGQSGPRTRLHAHESWGYRIEDLTQYLDGIICLCEMCHQCVHWGRTSMVCAERKLSLEPFIAHMAAVNDISREDVASAIDVTWKAWEMANTIVWKLEIDLKVIAASCGPIA